MKLCFIGKYPPIEGGVSSTNFWLARGLAERGHQVSVITNADEVEPAYRMLVSDDDAPWYQAEFPETGGVLRVFNTEPFERRTMDHIPASNPFVTKLASLATAVVREFSCEAIYAYYFEPYAIAGTLAAHWTGRPLVIKHAGSDLDRLCRVPDLATAYKEMLRSANLVVTQFPLFRRFLGMGVREEVLCPDVPFAIPGHVFHPGVHPLDIGRLTIRPAWVPASPAPFDPRLPTIGVYGKIGVSKGTYDLIAALGRLASERISFNFAAMIGADQANYLHSSLNAAGIFERTYILPFLPNWKVPGFIKACTAVCFLERDFPIEIHGPMVPREVLACATCLILSSQIAGKQFGGDSLVPGENLIVVNDPKNHDELAEKIRRVLTHPGEADAIGMKGAMTPLARQDYAQFISGWEQILSRVTAKPLNRSRQHEDKRVEISFLNYIAPRLRSLLERKHAGLIREFVASSTESDPLIAAVGFCTFAEGRLGSEPADSENLKFLDAIRYQKARLRAAFDRLDGAGPPFAVLDRLAGQRVSEESAGQLRPLCGRSAEILTFSFDITPLLADGAAMLEVPEPELDAIPPQRMYVLFQRTANLIPKELRINGSTCELLARCDGASTTNEVATAVCNSLATDTPEARGSIFSALDTLYRANIVVFGEWKPGWGWTGGARCAQTGIADQPCAESQV